MAKVKLNWNGGELRLQSMEGAGNLVRLEGVPVARLAHLSLHRVDLEFAKACLAEIEAASLEQWHITVLEAAWRSALLHYCKCFAPPQTGTGRRQLSASRIYGGESGQRMKDHRLMMRMRNKHLVHDEGTHNWCSVAVVIAPSGVTPKTLGIHVAAMDSVTLDPLTVPTLRELVNAAHVWVLAEFERLASEVEAAIAANYSHEVLLAKVALGVGYKDKAD